MFTRRACVGTQRRWGLAAAMKERDNQKDARKARKAREVREEKEEEVMKVVTRAAGQSRRTKSTLDRYYDRAQAEKVGVDEKPKDWMKSTFTGVIQSMPSDRRYSSPDVSTGVLLGNFNNEVDKAFSINIQYSAKKPQFLSAQHVGAGYRELINTKEGQGALKQGKRYRPAIWKLMQRHALFKDDRLVMTDYWNQSAHLPKPTPPKQLQAHWRGMDRFALADAAADSAPPALTDGAKALVPSAAAGAPAVQNERKKTAWGSYEPVVRVAAPSLSKKEKERRRETTQNLYPGALMRVDMRDGGGRGWGLVHGGGCVKEEMFVTMINWDGAAAMPDLRYWKKRLAEAYELRATLLNLKLNTAFRLVNGTGDGIPGVIVDIVGNVAVCVLEDPPALCYKALRDLLEEIGIVHVYQMDAHGRLFATWASKHIPDAELHTPMLLPSPHWASADLTGPQTVKFVENGIPMVWTPTLPEGAFTGHYANHRTARQLLLSIAKGKSVLDMFAYTGSMGLAAVYGGAKQVLFIETEKEYCDVISKNLSLRTKPEEWQKFCRIERGSVHNMDTRDRYDITIVDPPDITLEAELDAEGQVPEKVLRYYSAVLTTACNRTKRGGMIFLLCNLQHLPQDWINHKLLSDASRKGGGTLTIIRTISPSIDFPQDVAREPSPYLGLVLQLS
eukprot:TRINITY_DN19701_c0_g1_i1.p1 TRINITY_DN19701_c0_g1~~TRINITY_DN19701_c0_g1_i1.p1  ORF type:complete len:674 (+),score=258.12 TRINITY_DN19701_c0_g1_i1:79-2100(+)